MKYREINQTSESAFRREISRMSDDSGGLFTLFIVDIGDVSNIFVHSGEESSKKFLQSAVTMLHNFCRIEDRLCRIGDNRFGILLAGITNAGHQALAAEKLSRLYGDIVRDVGLTIQSSISIGIASSPEHAKDPAGLVHKASVALATAGKDCLPYARYSPETAASMSNRDELCQELNTAIDDELVKVFYQPKLDVASGEVIGAEALVRWPSDNHGFVAPSVFIPLADEIGRLNDLTHFVLTTCLQQAADWPAFDRPLTISVNIEAGMLQDDEAIEMIITNHSIWANDKYNLTVEITEGALVADSESNFRNLNRLRQAGIGISIDDFGTGYSSLSYFKNIPATELKIDKSFVSNMIESTKDRNLVETIIWLAHRFDLTVVAEGVENATELELLTKLNCDVIQGYYISEALPHDNFCMWLAKQKGITATRNRKSLSGESAGIPDSSSFLI